jgi:putative Mn2+ efflux pump MntP
MSVWGAVKDELLRSRKAALFFVASIVIVAFGAVVTAAVNQLLGVAIMLGGVVLMGLVRWGLLGEAGLIDEEKDSELL